MTLQKNAVAVRLFTRLVKVAGWLQNSMNKLTPPFRLMQMGSAFWQSRALYVAARLDVATVLGNERLSADAIAARVAADPDAVYRLLRLLAALGVFEEIPPRTFRNNALSAHLREDHPHSMRPMILMHNAEAMSRPWYESLEQGVRSGVAPFRLCHGQDFYEEYLDRHAEFDVLFARAMDSVEALAGDSFARDFDWARFRRVIDVGGSKGSKSLALLKRHPRLTALVVDRPQVIAEATRYWIGREPPERLARLSFQAGDVLESVPAAADDRDIYLLSAVLHGFDDADCIRALGNLAQASAGTGARIALLELVVDEGRADPASAAFDIQMFMATRGRERTLREWQTLFERSGLVLAEQVCLQSLAKLLVLRPAH